MLKPRIIMAGSALIAGLALLGAGCQSSLNLPNYSTQTSTGGYQSTTGTGGMDQNNYQTSTATNTSSMPASTSTTTNTSTLYDTAIKHNETYVFIAAMEDAGILNQIKGSVKYTMFVPHSMVFQQMPSSTIQSLLGSNNRDRLKNLIQSHLVNGSFAPEDLSSGKTLKSVNSKTITVQQTDGQMNINNVPVINVYRAVNGYIYILNGILPGSI